MENNSICDNKEFVTEITTYIENRFKSKGKPEGILTGIHQIDEITEGIKEGQVVTITTDTTGTISLFFQLMEICIVRAIPFLVYTTVTPLKRMGVLLYSFLLKIPPVKITRGFLKPEEITEIMDESSRLYKTPVYFHYNPVVNWKTLKNNILYHINANNIKIVFLENLNSLMKNENDEHEMFDLLKKLKEFASKNQIIIITNFFPKEKHQNKKVLKLLKLESDISITLQEMKTSESLARKFKITAINEGQCLMTQGELYFNPLNRKFFEM